MGRRTRPSRKSNSDKRIEELYIETLKEAKEGKILYQNLKEPPVIKEEVNIDEHTKKYRKRPEQMLEEAIKKQQELRKQRGTLRVPVSKLLPFRNDNKGFHFPQDFRRDDLSLAWVPRTDTESSCGITEYERLLWGECSDRGLCTPCSTITTETDADLTVEDTLLVLPLRSTEDDSASSESSDRLKSNLPPIYRRAEWRETMQSPNGPCRSIPAKSDSWCDDRGSAPLIVGKQELYCREKQRKNVMSLAERRIRLRSKSSKT